LSHLGRHSLEKFGGVKSVEYLVKNFNVDPDNLMVWLSPAAGRKNYPLSSFEGKSLQQVAKEQLASAGIRTSSVAASSIDTTKNDSYFSHSQFLSGGRKEDGRFAVVAIIEK
ncbi:MAG: laccase domain-containing protein, partial [Ignavibacteria bacterium]|nr:laccase domain-containing protein [Ignavibacteria bacterium]